MEGPTRRNGSWNGFGGVSPKEYTAFQFGFDMNIQQSLIYNKNFDDQMFVGHDQMFVGHKRDARVFGTIPLKCSALKEWVSYASMGLFRVLCPVGTDHWKSGHW